MHRKRASGGALPVPAFDSHDADAIHPSRFLAHFPLPDCIQSRRGAFISTHLKRIIPMASVDHTRMANAIRGLAMDAVEKAKSGHPGLPMAPPMSPPCCSRSF